MNAEELIDAYLTEYSSTGRLTMRDPSSTGVAGNDVGGSDTTNYTRRRKWLDGKPGGGIGTVTRLHPDDPPKWQRSEELIDTLCMTGEGLNTNYGPGSERFPPADAQSWERKKRIVRWKDGKPEYEYFSIGGLPGGVRDDPESPDSYGDYPGSDL